MPVRGVFLVQGEELGGQILFGAEAVGGEDGAGAGGLAIQRPDGKNFPGLHWSSLKPVNLRRATRNRANAQDRE